MKKLFTVIAMLALVGTVLSSGCKQEDSKPPEIPASTNAPAPAK